MNILLYFYDVIFQYFIKSYLDSESQPNTKDSATAFTSTTTSEHSPSRNSMDNFISFEFFNQLKLSDGVESSCADQQQEVEEDVYYIGNTTTTTPTSLGNRISPPISRLNPTEARIINQLVHMFAQTQPDLIEKMLVDELVSRLISLTVATEADWALVSAYYWLISPLVFQNSVFIRRVLFKLCHIIILSTAFDAIHPTSPSVIKAGVSYISKIHYYIF